KFSKAADGNLVAIGALSLDPAVKAAMDEPAFIAQVRQVDLVALAADLQRIRLQATAEVAIPSDDELPHIVHDVVIRQQLTDSTFGPDALPLEAETAIAPPSPAERSAEYWQRVSTVISLVDRPRSALDWVPRLADSFIPKI